jgi:uncharacterized protein with von Willebrand factor type A (vWA) domain
MNALAGNLLGFARVLRAAGLPLGTGRVLDGLRAVEAVGIERRVDFYWALHAVFVSRREQHEIFDQAFRAFFRRRDPQLESVLSTLLPKAPPSEAPLPEGARRVAEALGQMRTVPRPVVRVRDATLTFSGDEVLARKDFEQMSADELKQVREVLLRLELPVRDAPTRRLRPCRSDARGRRLDLRASLRAASRLGGDPIALRWRAPARRPPPLVVICDISGSMERYSRVLLHFVHALSSERQRVDTFLFGTRLTNVTRHLRHRDVDVALTRISGAVVDWSGGTRIGASLRAFNRAWSRRVLGQGAVVLLITDGLDRDGGAGLGAEMERLAKSCRRLIWLNPLLRYDAFEPRAQGIRAMLPHVDELRPVHNLQSLAGLADAISRPFFRTGAATRPKRR